MVCPSTTLSEVDSETVSKKDLAAYWGSDPVHLTPLGYAKLGEQLSEMVASDNRKKRGRERKAKLASCNSTKNQELTAAQDWRE